MSNTNNEVLNIAVERFIARVQNLSVEERETLAELNKRVEQDLFDLRGPLAKALERVGKSMTVSFRLYNHAETQTDLWMAAQKSYSSQEWFDIMLVVMQALTAVLMKETISQEDYDLLTADYSSVVGGLHPDDSDWVA